MEKPSSTPDSGGTTAYYTVFIDTSLDTHLAMIVSDSDTVSDLKKKILCEHPLCFPHIGGIKIHALKVKRKGYFYHLSDSMFVKSAFSGVSKSWFVSVDATILEEQSENQHSEKPNSGDLVVCLGIRNNSSADGVALLHDGPARRVSNIDDSSLPQVQGDLLAKEKPSAENDNNCNLLSLDTNNRLDLELQEKYHNKGTFTHTRCKENNSRKGIGDVQFNVSLQGDPETASVVKTQCKTKMGNEDAINIHDLNTKNASAHMCDEYTSWRDMAASDNDMVIEGRGTVVAYDMEMGSKNIADEPCKVSSSDTNQRPNNDLVMTDFLHEGAAVPGKHVVCKTYNSKNAVGNANCNMSLEEDSPGPAAKKKQRTVKKHDYGSSLKENSVLASDSTKEISGPGITNSQCPFGDEQKGTNANLDHLSTESLKDGNLLTMSPSSGKKKRKNKKKSSEFLNKLVTEVPSSAQDDRQEKPGDAVGVQHSILEREPDAAVFPEQSVRGAMFSEPCSISMKEELCASPQEVRQNSKVPCSVDVDMKTSDAGNVESKNDPPEVTAASAAKRIRISKDRHTIEAEGNAPLTVQNANNLNKDTEVTEHENAIFHDQQKYGSDQSGRAAEVSEFLQDENSGAMLSAKRTPSGRDELDSNSKAVITSNLLDVNGNVEPGKSLKKRRKSKKARDPVTSDTQHKTCSAIGISSTEPHETIQYDHSSDKSKKEEILLSPIEGKELSKTTAVKTSVLANDRETDNVIRNVLESLQNTDKTPVNTENKAEKSRKKTKRKRSSAAETLPELPTENENVSHKNVTLSIDGIREVEVEASSKLTKKTSSEHQLNGSNPEPEDNARVDANRLHAQLNPGIVNSSQDLSHTPEGNNEGRPLQDLNDNFTKSGGMDDANNNAEVQLESDRTIVNDNFVPSQHQHEIAVSRDMPVDKVTKTKGAVNEVKARKDRKKLDVHSNVPSIDLSNSLKSYENERSGENVQAKQSSGVELQKSLWKGEVDKLHPDKKLLKVSGIGAEAPASNKSKLSKTAKATRPNAVNASGTHTGADISKEAVATSNSTLESYKNILPQSKRGNRHQSHVDVRKVSNNNDSGEVISGSKHKKSLLAISGTIFKEDSIGSSDDEDGVHNSDTSTRTPSDNSLSSDYSDGDSNAQRNGSYSPKKKEIGRRNITKSLSSVKLDTILRSSSRYKAAKLTASQSQLRDTESQPMEFVPDSQADM